MKRLISGLAILACILLHTPRAAAQVVFTQVGQPKTETTTSVTFTASLAFPGLYVGPAMVWIDNSSAITAPYNGTGIFTAAKVLTPGLHTFQWTFANINVYSTCPIWVDYPAPTITSMSASSAPVGSAGGTLTVTGTNFVQDSITGMALSTIMWGNYTLPTTYVSATSVQASLPAGLFATAGTVKVTVSTLGVPSSTSLAFTINNPVPTLTAISPATVTHGGAAFTLTAMGSNFNTQSRILWNGGVLPATFISATSISVAIPANYILTAGTVAVSVSNPAPGGGTSATKTLTIK